MPYISAPAPNSENIFFDLILDAEFWNSPPVVDIFIDGEFIEQHTVDRNNYHIRFKKVMSFDSTHCLELKRSGKTDNETRFLPDGNIETQMLHIKTVKIDNINLRNLVWHMSTFQPTYPEPWASEQRAAGIELENNIQGEMYLGHNGVWRFEFTSPIYEFLVNWNRGNK
jgi:hypothetical protein